jgi:hypothetical protein
MFIKIIDRLITVLTRIRSSLVSKTVPSDETVARTVETEILRPTIQKRGRPKLNKPSPGQQDSHKKSRKSNALPKATKEKKTKRGTKRTPQQTLEKAEQVYKLIKNKHMTIAEACKSVGLAPSYYYKIRSKK